MHEKKEIQGHIFTLLYAFIHDIKCLDELHLQELNL